MTKGAEMTQRLSDWVGVERRYTRSVDIARDRKDPAALDGYVLTGSALSALRRLSTGLLHSSTQRAFRVTGPYGSGKSAFGLFLSHLMDADNQISDNSGSSAGHQALSLLGSKTLETPLPVRIPLVLSGRRVSFTKDLLAALEELAVDRFGGRKGITRRIRELQALQRDSGARSDARTVIDLLEACSQELVLAGQGGIALLVDEMGRFLEFAAARPKEEDPSVFQILAERASGSASNGLAVIAFLHHRFGDYGATLGEWGAAEWSRSSERYEEVPFADSREQTLHLLANALTHSAALPKGVEQDIRAAADHPGFEQAFNLNNDERVDIARRLYPLHPGVANLLLSVSRAFGQHERSLFNFLQSSDPSGFQHYLATTGNSADGNTPWYRPDDLFDYFASQSSLQFPTRDREKRWQRALDAVYVNAGLSEDAKQLTKTVGLVSSIEPIPGLSSDETTLAWLLGWSRQRVRDQIEGLVERNILYRRPNQDDVSLSSSASVDLSREFETARQKIPEVHRLDAQLEALPAVAPLLAQRHYHRTGTLRAFRVGLFDQQEPGAQPCDGEILVQPCYPTEDIDRVAQDILDRSSALPVTSLVRILPVNRADLEAVRDLACWRWINESCQGLRTDEISADEVLRQIEALEQTVSQALSPFSNSIGDAQNTSDMSVWIHAGARIDIPDAAALSRYLSEVCDQAFPDAPILKNELINRNKLSTVIMAARTRLVGAMATHQPLDQLGYEGAPPERTIYRSMFEASGLHRALPEANPEAQNATTRGERRTTLIDTVSKTESESAGPVFAFQRPPKADPLKWNPAWDCVTSHLVGNEPVDLPTVIQALERPPIGLRAGPALLLIAAICAAERRTVVLMERGTFVPDLDEDVFKRLAKLPHNFALRRIEIDSEASVLRVLCDRVQLLQETNAEPELKSVIEALFSWWGRLPDSTRDARDLSALARAVRSTLRKSTEPIDLLLSALPDACGAIGQDKTLDVALYADRLDAALQELDQAIDHLRDKAAAVLTAAFGTRSLSELRAQITSDYQDHALSIEDYTLRAFIDRAMNTSQPDTVWLDSVAGLIVGRRLSGWQPDSLDQFGFGCRDMAQRLARRLALMREMTARKSTVSAVHLTAPDGRELSTFVHHGDEDRDIRKQLHAALAEASNPVATLLSVLEPLLAAEAEERDAVNAKTGLPS